MTRFTLSDIRDIFTQDAERFLVETERLMRSAAGDGTAVVLPELLRLAHSIKGVAATINVWGLARACADLEALFELAESMQKVAPAEVERIFLILVAQREY